MNINNIPSTWQIVTVNDIASRESGACVTGPFGSSIGKKYWVDSGIPVIRGNNLTVSKEKFIDRDFVFITDDYANNEMKRYHAVADDILFTAAGTIGQVGIIPQQTNYPYYIISNKQMRLRINRNIVNPVFAYYYFRSKYFYNLIQNNNTGSTIPLINLGVLKSLPFVLPPLDEQDEIVTHLVSLDEKIELNLGINKILEDMAMAIYKEWFVDFGPFRDGEFVDTKLGPIPAGWQVRDIGYLTKLKYGKALKEKDRIFGEIPVYGSSGVVGFHNQHIVEGPALIIGRKGNVGSIYWENRNSYPIDTVYFINQLPLHSMVHLYFKFLTTDFTSRNSDSVVPGLNRKMAEEEPLIIPPDNVYERFIDVTFALFKLRFSNEIENNTLIELRDYLLPKLIGGEIRVKEAEDEFTKVI